MVSNTTLGDVKGVGMPDWLAILLGIIFAILCIGIPTVTLLYLNDRFKKKAQKAISDNFACFDISSKKQEGYIEIYFVTYYGLIFYTNQTEHRFFVRLDQAEQLVRKLHSYNLRFCWLAYGMIFIPLLSYLNLKKETRKIRRAYKV